MGPQARAASAATPNAGAAGIDEFHPTATGREIAALAPNGDVLEPWKDTPQHVAEAGEAVRRFLLGHTPG